MRTLFFKNEGCNEIRKRKASHDMQKHIEQIMQPTQWKTSQKSFANSTLIKKRQMAKHCSSVLRTISCVISALSYSARTLTTWRFLYETKPAREIKGHFLLNEHGDLSFFLHNFDEIIIFFELYNL